jgi:hypothetical protein
VPGCCQKQKVGVGVGCKGGRRRRSLPQPLLPAPSAYPTPAPVSIPAFNWPGSLAQSLPIPSPRDSLLLPGGTPKFRTGRDRTCPRLFSALVGPIRKLRADHRSWIGESGRTQDLGSEELPLWSAGQGSILQISAVTAASSPARMGVRTGRRRGVWGEC